MRRAGRFSRRIHGYAKADGIPLLHRQAGAVSMSCGRRVFGKDPNHARLVSDSGGPNSGAGVGHQCQSSHRTKEADALYQQLFVHILDPERGHITGKISGHPPFPAQVILNGHEYVACQARKAEIRFTKEGNCFTQISDATGLAKIADTLSRQQALGRLSQVCERWIYSSCLCFALELEERKRSGFH
jgi:hypothetical protein